MTAKKKKKKRDAQIFMLRRLSQQGSDNMKTDQGFSLAMRQRHETYHTCPSKQPHGIMSMEADQIRREARRRERKANK